jgi:hypothetical protein
MRKELIIEALVVGASTALAGSLLSKTGMQTGKPAFWFALGVLTHVGWEVVGGNRWYIETRNPEELPKGLLR